MAMPNNLRGIGAMIALLAIPISQADSQDPALDALMTKHVITCPDISLNSMLLIPRYYSESKMDSMNLILRYWNQECDSPNYAVRTDLLLAAMNKSFDESYVGRNTFYDLIYTRELYRKIKDPDELVEPRNTFGYRGRDEWGKAAKTYDTFLSLLARDALPHTAPGTLENLLARHYGGDVDSTFIRLQEPQFAESGLRQDYDEYVERIVTDRIFYYGLGFGRWSPIGSANQVLGSHPDITLLMGRMGGRVDESLSLSIRVGSTPTSYQFVSHGTTYSTTNFVGFGIGLELGYKVLNRPARNIMVIGGFDLEGYTPPKDDGNTDEKAVDSGHLTLGLSYGFSFGAYSSSPLIMLQARINPYIFNTSEIEGPLGGNVTVRLVVAFGSDDRRTDRLREISYRGLEE